MADPVVDDNGRAKFVEAIGDPITLLNGVTTTGNSVSYEPGVKNKCFSVQISGTATVLIQGSLDNSTWHTLATVTSTGGYVNEDPWFYIRGRVDAYTSGSITLYMGV